MTEQTQPDERMTAFNDEGYHQDTPRTPLNTWSRVGRALLGRWPSQVAQWGEEGIAAFVEELEADGLTPEMALFGLRSHRPDNGKDFPPSVAQVSALARRDASKPTFEEAYQLIYGQGGILRARPPRNASFADAGEMARAVNEAWKARAATVHPLVGSFALRYGLHRLSELEVNHPDYGDIKRRDLREAWGRHVEAMESRDVAALASGRRGELAQFDPLWGLRGAPVQIGRGE